MSQYTWSDVRFMLRLKSTAVDLDLGDGIGASSMMFPPLTVRFEKNEHGLISRREVAHSIFVHMLRPGTLEERYDDKDALWITVCAPSLCSVKKIDFKLLMTEISMRLPLDSQSGPSFLSHFLCLLY